MRRWRSHTTQAQRLQVLGVFTLGVGTAIFHGMFVLGKPEPLPARDGGARIPWLV